MTENSYLFNDNNKKRGGWMSRFAKFLFFVIAFFLVIITILANMGGTSDMLRESVARFTGDLFGGRPAKVGILYKMSFFPSVGVHASNIKVLSKPEEEGGYPVITIGEVEAFMSFWSVATSEPRFKKFTLQNIRAIKGVFVPEEFLLYQTFVDHTPGDSSASLIGNGEIGDEKWSFDIGLNIHGAIGAYSYSFPDKTPFKISMADVNLEGYFTKGGSEFFKFDDVKVTKGNKLVTLNIDAYAVSEGLLKIKGIIKDNKNNVEIIPDILMKKTVTPPIVNGDITIKNAVINNEIDQGSDILDIISYLREVIGYGQIDSIFDYTNILEYGKNVDVAVKLQNLKLGNTELIDLNIPYIYQNGFYAIGAFEQEGQEKPTILPKVIFLSTSEKKTAFIMLPGGMNVKVLSSVFKNLDMKTLPLKKHECGLGVYSKNDDGYKIENAHFQFDSGQAKTSGQTLKSGQGYADIELSFSKDKKEIEALSLDGFAYDFVQEQLRILSPNPTACDSLITRMSEKNETDKSAKEE